MSIDVALLRRFLGCVVSVVAATVSCQICLQYSNRKNTDKMKGAPSNIKGTILISLSHVMCYWYSNDHSTASLTTKSLLALCQNHVREAITISTTTNTIIDVEVVYEYLMSNLLTVSLLSATGCYYHCVLISQLAVRYTIVKPNRQTGNVCLQLYLWLLIDWTNCYAGILYHSYAEMSSDLVQALSTMLNRMICAHRAV